MQDQILIEDGIAAFQPGAPATIATITSRYSTSVESAIIERQRQHERGLSAITERCDALARIAEALIETLRSGGKVLVGGNGGSAAEAQHFAGELVGRFKLERQPYAVIALCVDSAILTAVGNDYGFEQVFARQVRALGRAGDLLLAYSTSGESENLIQAAQAAREQGMTVAAITGDHPSRLDALADLSLRVPATDTPIVQELQMVVTHILCGIAEAELAAGESEAVR